MEEAKHSARQPAEHSARQPAKSSAPEPNEKAPRENTPTSDSKPWHDTSKSPKQRAAALIELMTLEGKLAQLVGRCAGADAGGAGSAAHQADAASPVPQAAVVLRPGLGHMTSPYGTVPVDPAAGVKSLHQSQQERVATSRVGIPAQAHEECLAGFAAWP